MANMTTTEEIVVSGKNFIERRILVCAERQDLEDLHKRAYARGYSYGWGRGFFVGSGLIGAIAFCIWLAGWW
jgi:hypothetical protein